MSIDISHRPSRPRPWMELIERGLCAARKEELQPLPVPAAVDELLALCHLADAIEAEIGRRVVRSLRPMRPSTAK